jgi:hypothetical protein
VVVQEISTVTLPGADWGGVCVFGIRNQELMIG